MIDILEFRAWDQYNKVMHYEFEWMTVKDHGTIIFQSDIKDHNWEVWPPEFDNDFSGFIVMGNIRVNDKNGKKIFDNDYVKVIKGDKEFVGYVCYGHGGCPTAIDVENDDEHYLVAYFDNKETSFEVIGNYFENTELQSKLFTTTKIKFITK